MNAGVIITIAILIMMFKNIGKKMPYGVVFTIGVFVFISYV